MLTHKQMVIALGVLTVTALLAFLILFFVLHEGLPTGDSQKSIIWAELLLKTGRLSNYQEAIPLLNRDPVDFYTPALHILTAVVLRIGNLPAIGISAILFSILTAIVAASIAHHVLPKAQKHLGTVLTFILVLTHERFLRYVREPGYHYQNIVGELLLFILLLLGLHLLERWRWHVFLGMIATAALLPLTHQFSAFIGFFAALPLVITLAFRYRRAATILIPFIAAFLIVAIPLGLHEKIAHIFTSSPHLLPQTPSLARTLSLMGAPWMIIGVAGVVLLARRLRGNLFRTAFFISTLVLLALSQGPRLGIDIPPVRALLYSAIPLSITGAYFLSALWQKAHVLPSQATRLIAHTSVIALVAVLASVSAARAFTLSHALRTNSTLTPGQLQLVSYLREQPEGGILIDDYNRRSASWLVLSGHPMFTRIAADLETQMNEARQSELRYQLYLNQLDFEKIFSLGSLPEVMQLMEKHGITYLTGIDGSSTSHFSHNPALEEVKKVDDSTLFRPRNTPEESLRDTSGVAERGSEPAGESASRDYNLQPTTYQLSSWLLKPSTLANDIGDLEDTFEHLPASLRATRLSEPKNDDHITFRTTSAPLIPLKFNVGDYVRILWDQDQSGKADSALELLVQFTNSPSVIQKISPENAPIDHEGFITLTINNPRQKTLSLDLIALGLAHTP